MTEKEAREIILGALVRSNVLDAARKQKFEDEADSDVELASLGIDSMAVINFCVALEESLHRDVEIEELVENPSLVLLARHFAAKSAQR